MAVSGCSTKPVSPKLQTNLLRDMFVYAVKNANLFGVLLKLMAPLSLRSLSMGDMEIIDQCGVKATFTDKGVFVDVVPDAECCVACNDARLLREGTFKVCFMCGCRQ